MTGEAARACCMSETAFRRRFKQEFGEPVSEWLRRQRMARIERMLRDPAIPLWQVAEHSGFNMASTFSDFAAGISVCRPGRCGKISRNCKTTVKPNFPTSDQNPGFIGNSYF